MNAWAGTDRVASGRKDTSQTREELLHRQGRSKSYPKSHAITSRWAEGPRHRGLLGSSHALPGRRVQQADYRPRPASDAKRPNLTRCSRISTSLRWGPSTRKPATALRRALIHDRADHDAIPTATRDPALRSSSPESRHCRRGRDSRSDRGLHRQKFGLPF